MNKLKFPKLPFSLSLIRKLSDSQIKTIRSLRKQGWSLKKLSKSFKVSDKTILYWTSESFRQKHIKATSEYKSKISDIARQKQYEITSRENAKKYKPRVIYLKKTQKNYYEKNAERKILMHTIRYYRDKMRFYQSKYKKLYKNS